MGRPCRGNGAGESDNHRGMDGRYQVSAPANATLVFSFIGKTTQEIAIGTRTTVDITLPDDSKSL